MMNAENPREYGISRQSENRWRCRLWIPAQVIRVMETQAAGRGAGMKLFAESIISLGSSLIAKEGADYQPFSPLEVKGLGALVRYELNIDPKHKKEIEAIRHLFRGRTQKQDATLQSILVALNRQSGLRLRTGTFGLSGNA